MTISGFDLHPIGRVESTLKSLDDAPRQRDEGAPGAWLIFTPDVAPALANIKDGDELDALDGTPIVDVKPLLNEDIALR